MISFDPENPVNKLCARGMQLEGEGKPEEAAKLFNKAWDEASDPIEKLTAAHYVARCQRTVAEKLEWDIVALQLASEIGSENVKPIFPSLYLNVGKGYEDLKDIPKATENYELALSFAGFLPKDGYGNMIAAGINKAIDRLRGANLK